MENRYIKLRSKNKIAWLYTNNMFEDSIVEEIENGKLQVFFLFKKTDEVEKLLQEFRENDFLNMYCKSFKNVNFAIARYRREKCVEPFDIERV
ncbi:DUF5659 domain-containing protein [Clostridium sp. UBA1652]|uniref:DUF5659 domain-containing protein n=1 Tax=Clostridium sp. UBA1652 TaxID=1946348 RepID=UPI00257BE96B|nr:DUF5659 domain-containing protein [Clostridium sp. UBA1652]